MFTFTLVLILDVYRFLATLCRLSCLNLYLMHYKKMTCPT